MKEKSKKETCPRCNGSVFAIAKDKSNKHYCQAKGCHHVWVPGADASGRIDLAMKATIMENEALKTEITQLRKEVETLKSQLTKIEKIGKAAEASSIFT